MQHYDISHVPAAVHDALLHLTAALVQAVPLDPTGKASPTPAVPALPAVDTGPVFTTAHCPHGTAAVPCCLACATVHTAEAVLVDVQTEGVQPRFPRRDVELRVLEALQALYPMPATSIQVAALVNVPPLEVRTILQALAILETVEHPRKGYYRHRPSGDGAPASARFAAQIADLCDEHKPGPPRLPSTGTCGDVSPHEGGTHV